MENEEIFKKIDGLKVIHTLKFIYSFDDLINVNNWKELVELGITKPQVEKMNTIQNSISDDDLFTLIYTSGTTGNPKGVMITHSNIISQISALKDALDWNSNDRAVSFLPLSHVFERMVEYFYMFKGVSIYYDVKTIGDDLKLIDLH